jgi:hypothetical protein
MKKFLPLIGLMVAGVFMYRAADQMTVVSNAQSSDGNTVNTAPKPAEQRAATTKASNSKNEPAYKSVIRCLSDLDDILDGITGLDSFTAAKPKLLAHVRQQAALAAEAGNQGMQQMSKAASKEMKKAVNRHTESLIRANNVAPGVAAFFEKEVAAILNPK